MSPRDIQARIRAGATAEEVASESGLDMARILRYEGPVRAERDYMVEQAQKVEVSGPLPSNDGYRSALGDTPTRLVEMVDHRLRSFGVDRDDVRWDSWRGRDGVWQITADFDLPESPVDVGEAPPARWTFVPTRKSIANANRWAQILSELEPLDGPLPARRLSAVADRPFDFEADTDKEPEDQQDQSDELLDALRSRRGQRLGADEDGDDALALLLSKGSIPAAHPRRAEETPDQESPDDGVDATEETISTPAARRFTSLSLAPSLGADDGGLPHLHDGVSSATHEIIIPAGEVHRDYLRTQPKPVAQTTGQDRQDDRGSAAPEADTAAPRTAGDSTDRKNIKPKRSSMPSWDEIVFGTKGD